MFGADGVPGMPPLPEWMADLANKGADMGSSGKEKSERDARWIGDWSDELTVSIALREWETAVALVEEGESKLQTIPSLGTKLTPLKAALTAALLQSLSAPSNKKSAVVSLISLLVRLKAGAAARNTFLTARADVIKKCVRKITFEGHIGSYIADLATVVFTGIKHTADWFLASFKENEVASSKFSASCSIDKVLTTVRLRGMGKATDRAIRADVQEAGLQLRRRTPYYRGRRPDYARSEQEAARRVRHRLPLPPRQPPPGQTQGRHARPPSDLPPPRRTRPRPDLHALPDPRQIPVARTLHRWCAVRAFPHTRPRRAPGPGISTDPCTGCADAARCVSEQIAIIVKATIAPAAATYGQSVIVAEPDAIDERGLEGKCVEQSCPAASAVEGSAE